MDVGDVHPHQLARHRVDGIAGQEVHALDKAIHRHDGARPGCGQARDIVAEAERAGAAGQRAEVTGDGVKLLHLSPSRGGDVCARAGGLRHPGLYSPGQRTS